MPDEKMAGIMRELVKAMAAGEVDKTLSYVTDDIVYVTPYGADRGKDGFRRSLTAMAKNMQKMNVTETGNGIITDGNKAFFEHVLSGFYQGKKFEMLAMCAYEFAGDKIKNVRSVYDRLLIAKQVVGGWPATPLVNMVVKQSEKAMK
jgi:predicted ester cyclase